MTNQYRFAPAAQGRAPVPIHESLEDDEPEEVEEVKYYTDDFKAEISGYRQKVAIENKHKKTVKTNLDSIFSNFKVVT